MTNETDVNTISHDDGVTVVGKGELDLKISRELDKALSDAAVSGLPVTVDFLSVGYIDSAIIQSIARYGKVVYDRGERMKVLVISGSHPEYVLETVGFNCFIDIVAEKAPEAVDERQ